MRSHYFEYSRHKTEARAESALEHYFAAGEISEGEQPRIECRRDHRNRVQYYAVMFPAE